MPSQQEALRLLEERKRIHIPDESKRAIPQTRDAKKRSGKERKRKSDSSSHGESTAKRASGDTIHTAVPLRMRPSVEEASSP